MHHHMSFYWDTNLGEFLFPGLNINGPIALGSLCGVLLFLAIVYEGIKVQQVRSRALAARERLRRQSCPAGETSRLIAASMAGLSSKQLFFRKLKNITIQAFIFLSQNTLGYILMLTVMVYNAYVFIVIILGLGLGYFLFGHITMKINMENIRARTTHVICSPTCSQEQSTSGSQDSNKKGYINEIATVSSSTSDENSSCDTQSTQLAKVDIHSSEPNINSNVIHSCHL